MEFVSLFCVFFGYVEDWMDTFSYLFVEFYSGVKIMISSMQFLPIYNICIYGNLL